MRLAWFGLGLLVAALSLAMMGCASQFGPAGMTPEQLTAWGKVKDQQAGCIKAVGAGITISNTYWNVDRGVTQGSVTIKDDCTITYTSPAQP